MSNVKTVAHLNIQFTDKARTKDFYERVFDAEIHDQGQLQARMGGVEIHFSPTTEPIHAPLVHFAMEIDDWDSMMATLAEQNVEHGRTLGLGRAGTHREQRGGDDPDHNVIELIHYPTG